jgi:hypothetical protein
MAAAFLFVAAIDIATASRGRLADVCDRARIALAHAIQTGHAG